MFKPVQLVGNKFICITNIFTPQQVPTHGGRTTIISISFRVKILRYIRGYGGKIHEDYILCGVIQRNLVEMYGSSENVLPTLLVQKKKTLRMEAK